MPIVVKNITHMGKIFLEGMEFFAYHGHYKEEQIIGTKFTVDLELEFDTVIPETTDHLSDTVNYQEIYKMVQNEMEQKSHLLEHVARRILDSIRQKHPLIGKTTVKLSKLNPAVGGKMRQVTCVLSG